MFTDIYIFHYHYQIHLVRCVPVGDQLTTRRVQQALDVSSHLVSTLLYPSLCYNDAETDQHNESMLDTKTI